MHRRHTSGSVSKEVRFENVRTCESAIKLIVPVDCTAFGSLAELRNHYVEYTVYNAILRLLQQNIKYMRRVTKLQRNQITLLRVRRNDETASGCK